MNSDYKNRLLALFQTNDEAAFRTRLASLDRRLHAAEEIYIFGAGQNGQLVANRLTEMHFKIAGFIDETPSKQNTAVNEIPVHSLQYLAERHATVVISSIFSPYVGFQEIAGRLSSYTNDLMSLFEFLWFAAKDDSASFYFLNHPTFLHRHFDDVMWLCDRLVDKDSQEQLFAHIRFRLDLDFGGLPSVQRIFWPSELPAGPLVYVDCGAYDGDTLVPFMRQHGNHVRLALPIEPDPHNFLLLTNNIESLDDADRRKVVRIAAATGEANGKLRFDIGKKQASSLSEAGELVVDVVALDDVVAEHCTPDDQVIVKIDVEGADLATLKGATHLIGQRHARLAISVYHKPFDLWELPQYVAQIDQNYRFFLRSNGADGADLMIYACVP